MLIRLLSATLIAMLPNFAAAQEKKTNAEHPYAKAKVGDWVTYASTTDVMGMKFESTITTRVTAKDDKSVTLKTGGKNTFMGMTMDLPESETKVDLTIPFDPNPTPVPKDKKDDIKVEKVSDGKEKLKIGGKEYECTWTKSKYTAKADGKEIVTESTIWMSKDVPFNMVKMETKFEGGGSKMELKEFGSGKK